MRTAMESLTAEQLEEIRQLIRENGYLPYSPKALRLIDQADRLLRQSPQFDPTQINNLRDQINEKGYLPSSKGQALVDEVQRLQELLR